MTRASPPIAVLALGSPHGDDQAGWMVADALAADTTLEPAVHKLTSPWDAVAFLQTAERVIVVDACRTGAAPGTVHRFTAEELAGHEFGRSSTHGVSLADALDLARTLGGRWTDLVVHAVELETDAPGPEMSAAVRDALPKLERAVRNTLSDWGATP